MVACYVSRSDPAKYVAQPARFNHALPPISGRSLQSSPASSALSIKGLVRGRIPSITRTDRRPRSFLAQPMGFSATPGHCIYDPQSWNQRLGFHQV